MKDFVTRVHLNTDCGENRARLINYCLTENPENQCLAIGWSNDKIYPDGKSYDSFEAYYQRVRDDVKRLNPAINLFREAEKDDLFWTRDLDGFYWICRATGPAESRRVRELDIGAVIPVKAYKYSMEVPGQIKASFNRARGGIAQRIHNDLILEYSMFVYNNLSGSDHYTVHKNYKQADFLTCLPDFELEELVIAYIQIKYDYYVLSNSIANKSTTIKIECEFRSRNLEYPRKAVVQVKGGNDRTLTASDYQEYIENGYCVYLYAPHYTKDMDSDQVVYIGQEELLDFVSKYWSLLPENITQWRYIFDK
ncbi:MAG: ribonuclease D [Oscillospiraceae bacterium]|nr:ribonuclease D [Oscillospiraceae bacterium]